MIRGSYELGQMDIQFQEKALSGEGAAVLCACEESVPFSSFK